MHLTVQEAAEFYNLWYGLVWAINEKHKIIPHFKKPIYGIRVSISLEAFCAVRDKMWENPAWIDEYLADKKNKLTPQEHEIISLWRKNFVKGDFVVIKQLKKHAVLMRFDAAPNYMYGVYGISDSIKDTFKMGMPYLLKLVLVPFKGKIVYDSLAQEYNISLGSGLRTLIKEWQDATTKKYGIIEKLNEETPELKPNIETVVSSVSKKDKIPKALEAQYTEVAELINAFCSEKLNAEYNELCLHALKKLCRKRPSPLLKGRARTWACGIVYAIGSVNFIFDKSQPINMTAAQIAEAFDLSKSTASNKATEINNILDISYFSFEYLLKELIDKNPAIWMLEYNGMITDVRKLPREVQEEALRKGYIPYLPND